MQDAGHGQQTVPTSWLSRLWTGAARWQWAHLRHRPAKSLEETGMWCQPSRWDIRRHALSKPWATSRNSEWGAQQWIELWNNRPAVPWRNNTWDFSVLSLSAHPFCMFIFSVPHLYSALPGHYLSGLFVCFVCLNSLDSSLTAIRGKNCAYRMIADWGIDWGFDCLTHLE